MSMFKEVFIIGVVVTLVVVVVVFDWCVEKKSLSPGQNGKHSGISLSPHFMITVVLPSRLAFELRDNPIIKSLLKFGL